MRRSISSARNLLFPIALLFSGYSLASAQETGSSELSHAALARLVRVCAPQVNSTTQAAIVAVESGGSPLAIHDDNDDHVYAPHDYSDARNLSAELIARNRAVYGVRDRGIDVGLAQINSSNFVALGVTAADMLDPCTNLHASAQIIADAYDRERRALTSEAGWHGDQLALARALQDYNSGRPTGDDAYVHAIFSAVNGALVHDVGDGATVSPVPVLPFVLVPSQQIFARSSASSKREKSKRTSAVFYHSPQFDSHPQSDTTKGSGVFEQSDVVSGGTGSQ